MVVHLTWRLLVRVGVSAWLATILSILLMFLGAGSVNVLWAFQFGFMGAIALGLLVLLLFDRAKLNVPLIIAASVLAPTFSGTALPVLAAAAIVGWVRHGFRKTALLLLPAAVCYLVWFALIGSEHPAPGAGIHSVTESGTAVLFAAAMFGAGLGRMLVGFNAALLVVKSGVQAAREEVSKKRIIASLVNVLANPTDPTLLEKPADPEWAPDLLGSDLVVLYDDGQFRP